jgi:23S rRNA G2445 N2-methylase RlmL
MPLKRVKGSIIAHMKYIAFVTKGLEKISEEEVNSLEGVVILESRQKILIFEYKKEWSNFQSLKTVDDIGILISEIPTENLLNCELSEEIKKIKSCVKILKEAREVRNQYSLTISKYKNNDFVESALKDELSNIFSKNLNMEYTPLDHTNFDIRFNIIEQKVLISVKLFPRSLFRRKYEHESRIGSLRSTIASSILFKLLHNRENLKIVDNFCGSGTFLCESLILGHDVYGNDIDKEAVFLTQKNLNKIRRGNYEITKGDASKTNWKGRYFDVAVSNLPWDKQIKVHKLSKMLDDSLREYSRILKEKSQIGLICTKPEVVVKYLKKYFDLENISEYKIGYLGQVPTVIIAGIKGIITR